MVHLYVAALFGVYHDTSPPLRNVQVAVYHAGNATLLMLSSGLSETTQDIVSICTILNFMLISLFNRMERPQLFHTYWFASRLFFAGVTLRLMSDELVYASQRLALSIPLTTISALHIIWSIQLIHGDGHQKISLACIPHILVPPFLMLINVPSYVLVRGYIGTAILPLCWPVPK